MAAVIICICCEMIILCSLLLYSYAADTIAVNTTLRDGETLISAGGRFELGFFTPAGTSENARYVGIWYYKLDPRTVVWVANREKPLLNTGGYFSVQSGNLEVFDPFGKSSWSTNLKAQVRYKLEARLMDSGNLILTNQVGMMVWQSFEHPTDTFLPGMNLKHIIMLTSWTSQVDPAPGKFMFKQDQNNKNQFVILNDYIAHWKSGVSGEFFTSEKVPSKVSHLLLNYTSVRLNGTTVYSSSYNYNNTRVVISFNGEIQYWSLTDRGEWSLEWQQPKDRCSVLEACGVFGSCNNNNKMLCKCLAGFKPKLADEWSKGIFTSGCISKSTACGIDDDMFLNLKMMRVENTEIKLDVKNVTECRDQCLKNCRCLAYSYSEEKNSTGSDIKPINSTCWIWTEDLKNLQEEYANGGHDLFVRVSNLESTIRSCGACGADVIPYPLSTGLNCGDPTYFSFDCNTSEGKLRFKAPGGIYNVTNINPDTGTFVIQAKALDNCNARTSTVLMLNQSLDSLPFKLKKVTPFCGADAELSPDISSKDITEIEISWDPPVEPSCETSADCKDWPYSVCNVTSNGMQRRCLCNANFRWNGSALNCTSDVKNHELYGKSSKGKKPLALIIGIGLTIASVILLSCAITFIWRRQMARRKERRESTERNATILYGTEKRVKDFIDSEDFKEEDKNAIDVPSFDLDSILAATNNFSEFNKLGRGGFGPVYKGVFPGGREIAIKRLSSVSGQGLEEFKNEVVLIARLQHRNLVRLLGYCIKGEEKLLLYEYMSNKSLDFFLFDEQLSVHLNWEMRFNIIAGVARGILYLHQDSRLRIIHRDLKTSNILLDEEMNPKISDFGLARIFEGKQTEGTTNRVIGT
ncbi:G-type lectin S-receptor-like serine/threonine-protein kinase At4g03230 isoform X2 [Mercurialis annua]|nr:G-type lectin S-receptor-like serine/threonine-protein kinase At4g03230 isoform X2 [Mercurialis annua]